ncbi:hypothetical protein BpHYR1_027531 [Brachionus plicatilis]|uniref:Uncharacterized protein n=1 Tax=Brachionus plicatilis TaxID=10195 RepID=A0A3M7SP37_BRAPC|nr:hypothetical protein BpHYR1_027531 [Brachionus plicatilis]
MVIKFSLVDAKKVQQSMSYYISEEFLFNCTSQYQTQSVSIYNSTNNRRGQFILKGDLNAVGAHVLYNIK